MSAFVVDRGHIWYLVQAAVSRMCREPRMSWYHEEKHRTVSSTEREGLAEVGQMLWDENVRSVKYRYDDCDELPGPIGCDYQYGRHNGCALPRLRVEPVQVLKACDCFEYQSCEHPGWEESEAHSFLEALRRKAWHALPGYDDARWEIGR